MTRIPSLDGFRAISIILVLICHSRLSAGFPVAYADLARHGKVGVTVFFVISGFLITTLLLKEEEKHGQISVRAFYLRRAFRILPVFIVYTGFVLLMKNFQPISLNKGSLLHVLTFTVNFDRENSWFLGHLWSLSVEEQFYLLWPLLLIISRKYLQPIVLLLILYGCVARVIDHKFRALSLYTLAPFFMYADAILLGALAAITLKKNPQLIQHRLFNNYWLQIAAVGIIALFINLSGYGKVAIISLPFSDLAISASFLYLILSYLTPSNNWAYRFLNSKAMVHIGVLSYSLYIWQQFFIVGNPVVWYRVWPLNMLVIYLVSLASYYLLERPIINIKKRLVT